MSRAKRFSGARVYGSMRGAWGHSAKHWTRLLRAPKADEWDSTPEPCPGCWKAQDRADASTLPARCGDCLTEHTPSGRTLYKVARRPVRLVPCQDHDDCGWAHYEFSGPVVTVEGWLTPSERAVGGGVWEAMHCGAVDRAGDHVYGTCTLPAGHGARYHQEYRDGQLWAEWSG